MVVRRDKTKSGKRQKPQKAVGPKQAFTRSEVEQIEALLERESSPTALRDWALFRVGIDTMLRSSDLRALMIEDVMSAEGHIRRDLYSIQSKTNHCVHCRLSAKSAAVLQRYLEERGGLAARPERLFDISDRHHRRIIKRLAAMIRLDAARYSTHSVRRTRAKAVYAQTKNLGAVRVLLGHSSIGATATYLGIDAAEAHAVADTVEI